MKIATSLVAFLLAFVSARPSAAEIVTATGAKFRNVTITPR
jgi:hypothetical protein